MITKDRLVVAISGCEHEKLPHDKETVTTYVIHVLYRNADSSDHIGKSVSWEVRHRYSDFNQLYHSLKSHANKYIANFHFPKKTIISLHSKEDIETKRRASLEQYLQLVVNLDPLPQEVISFLQIDQLQTNEPGPLSLDHVSSDNSNESHTTKSSPHSPRINYITEDEFHKSFHSASPVGSSNKKGIFSSFRNVFHSHNNSHVEESKSLKLKLASLSDSDVFVVFGLFTALFGTLIVYSKAILHLLIDPYHFFQSMNPLNIIYSSYFHSIRIAIETIIVCFIVVVTFHRFLGYVATVYLQKTMLQESGAFNMSIEWISFRLGLDRNEIIIHGFKWKNPDAFKRTPYFIGIENITMTIDMERLIEIFFHNEDKPIHIPFLAIDNLHVHIERGEKKVQGMNLWAALGANEDPEEIEVQKLINKSLSKHSPEEGNAYRPGKYISKGAKFISGKIIKKNGDDEGLSNGDVHDIQSHNNEEHDHTSSHSPEVKRNNSEHNDHEDSKYHHENSTHDDDEEDDEEDGHGVDQTVSQFVPEHMGIPYKFEVDRLSLSDFQLFAADYLSAKHVEGIMGKPILIEILNLTRRDLLKPPKRGVSRNRRPVYLDELVSRLINCLITKLLATNKLAMLTLMTSGVTSQATNAVLNVAHTGMSTVTDVIYNYNPVEIAKNANKTISGIFHREEVKTLTRTSSIEALGVHRLQVRIVKLRNLKHPNGKTATTVKCLMRLRKEGDVGELVRSHVSTRDREGDVTIRDCCHMTNLTTLDSFLHFRVFEAGLLSHNVFIGDLNIPLRQSLRYPTNETKHEVSKTKISTHPTEFIGVKDDEVIAWHKLYGEEDRANQVVGEVLLGLTLI